ncbi:GntR family transcriptional regulator [Streptomyces phaeochromogenes]|uniref:GntR family transcriptional regulator n=1 Tax=Streptomyces phaeochromogenes TaxID=1923 RepID=UPI002DDBB2C5|nr:GntR family transcriptional regulator [Streptomyces phaeochromogenes]
MPNGNGGSSVPEPPEHRPLMTPEQIRKVIGNRLADGTYSPGTLLPTERNLSVEFGVRAWAVRWALQPLKDNGHLRFAPGRGNLVLDPQSPAPVGCGIRDIEQAVRSRLGDGTYAVGTWLPTMRHLAAEFRVGPTSIHKALTPLEQEKLLASLGRRGTYVADPRQPGVPPPRRTSQTTVANVGQTLRERLRDSTYPPGSPLPTNAELSAEFEVRSHLISTALKPIRSEGLVSSGPRCRLYAARPTSEPPAPVRNAPREPVSCDAATTSEQDHQ